MKDLLILTITSKAIEMSVLPRSEDNNSHRPTATEPRTSKDDDFWKKIDEQFQEVTNAAKTAFVLNKNINIVLVAIGIIFILNAIFYSWLKNADLWNTILGGVGIGTFVVIFFINSQSNINKAVASLAQTFMIYKSHSREYESITDYDYEMQQKEGARDLNEVKDMNIELERTTQFYVNLINTNLQAFKDF